MSPIVIQRDDTLSEGVIKSIRGMDAVNNMLEKAGIERCFIHEKSLQLIKKFYDGLNVQALVTLWHDNWNTLQIMNKDSNVVKDNTSYLVVNKLMAISSIIQDKY